MTARTVGLEAFKRYLTLKTHKIHALPIVVLMPHSGCNCRCVMCDIWKNNGNPHQLTESDVRGLLASLKKLHTRWVLMSGGEALMTPNLFRLCDILRDEGMKVTILSTGLLLTRYARQLVDRTDEVIVSLDGPEAVHNAIRRVPNAFRKLAEGVRAVKSLSPDFPVTARCVVQRMNFEVWPDIVDAAHALNLDSISFLPADVTSSGFNRTEPWSSDRQAGVLPPRDQLPRLKAVLDALVTDYVEDFASGYIVESPAKIRRVYDYYAAHHGLTDFPPVQCNAPWVSAVVEADGAVRPCFFHPPLGNVRDAALVDLLNTAEAIAFRRGLDMASDPICRRCVCSLNLRPTVRVDG